MSKKESESSQSQAEPRIVVGASDVLEEKYIHRLQSYLADYGLPIVYPRDRATIDLGLHLFNPKDDSTQHRTLSGVRVWMQCKSLKKTTLTQEAADATGKIPVAGLSTEHVKFWYLASEPVYLVVYVESLDAFFARDTRQLVDEQLRPSSPNDITRHRTVTLTLSTNDTLEKVPAAMLKHQSMRIDGTQFRGMPLNHSFDPLRTTFKPTSPETFRNIVTDLLDAHNLRTEQVITAEGLFDRDIGDISILRGTLNSRYEWTSPLFTEYGYDGESNFRVESAPISAQGEVVVLVHSDIKDNPRQTAKLDEQVEGWRGSGVTAALVFYNGDSTPSIGAWRSSLGGLCAVPQGIDSLSFNILTNPSLYLKYMYELEPKVTNRVP